MNDAQIDRSIEILKSSPWEHQKLDDNGERMWRRQLRQTEPADFMPALDLFVASGRTARPLVTEFVAEVQARHRKAALATPPTPGPRFDHPHQLEDRAGPVSTPERTSAELAKIRQAIPTTSRRRSAR